MKKDCKKLQKNIGKWMLETTTTSSLSHSDLKCNVKKFLEANVEKPAPAELIIKDDLPPDTSVYKWSSPHIKSF